MGELLDVLTLLADQGADCLSWNKEVDDLLLLSLLLISKKKEENDEEYKKKPYSIERKTSYS